MGKFKTFSRGGRRREVAKEEPPPELLNFCVPGALSHCSAGTTWADQQNCRFAQKSAYNNRCIHYIESIGGHCDCVEAQWEIQKSEN